MTTKQNNTATTGTEGKPELLMSVTRHEKAEWKRLAQDAYNKGKSGIGDRFNDYASDADFIRLPISIFDELQKEYRDWLINGFATPPSDQPHKRQESGRTPEDDGDIRYTETPYPQKYHRDQWETLREKLTLRQATYLNTFAQTNDPATMQCLVLGIIAERDRFQNKLKQIAQQLGDTVSERDDLLRQRDELELRVKELEAWKSEAVATSERQLVAFQEMQAVAQRKESEKRKLLAILKDASEFYCTDANTRERVRAAIASVEGKQS